MEAEAELIADRGASAESDDFFRSRPFCAAQGVSHTLRISSGRRRAALPLVVREIPGSELDDGISPYGYSGGLVSGEGAAPGAGDVDWSGLGLVSVFVREPVGAAPSFADPTPRSTVLIHDPGRPRGVRRRLAEQIRHNERRGWKLGSVRGPEASDADLDSFASIYQQTMVRARAGPGYFFEHGYFRSILAFQRSWLLLARGPGGAPGAGAIAALSDGLLHYYLGGTADEALGESPFKNVVAAMLDLADELGALLNLGGGVTPGDGLEEFKRGFANAELPFHTSEIVCDRREYERLAAGHPRARGAGGFFPAYRAA